MIKKLSRKLLVFCKSIKIESNDIKRNETHKINKHKTAGDILHQTVRQLQYSNNRRKQLKFRQRLMSKRFSCSSNLSASAQMAAAHGERLTVSTWKITICSALHPFPSLIPLPLESYWYSSILIVSLWY